MTSLADKVILVDCDGVLLDWEYAFDQWMKRHHYEKQQSGVYDMAEAYGIDKFEMKRLIRMFNESATVRRLPPLRDAIKYVRKLHSDKGFVFHAITSQTNDEYAQHLRIKNLCELFGPSVFERYVILDCGADKDEALAEYKDSGCIWVEDKIANAEVGSDLGLRSVLMKHEQNKNYQNSDIPLVENWADLYHNFI
jgi:hypothetical protein